MFDVDSIDVAAACEAGHEFELMNPLTQEPLRAYVTVRGFESGAVTGYLQSRSRADTHRAAIARRRNQPAPEVTPEEAEGRAVELAVACTMAWRNVRRKGQDLACTPEDAAAIYRQHPWMALQVIDQARDLGNFAPKGSAKRSTSPGTSSAST